jgi:5-methyltetrahydropteroyltriglutamate--homocysteine methyltransferase
MKRAQPPFRADHVGSLLRPPQLLQARDQAKRNEISGDSYVKSKTGQ